MNRPNEKALLTQAEATHAVLRAEHHTLNALFTQAPAAIVVYRGPRLIVEFINPVCRQILGNRPEVGRSILECVPELAETAAFQVLSQVFATGEPISGNELLVSLDRNGNGRLEEGYFNFTTQPLRGADGTVEGVVAFAVEVTEQVRARQQVETLAAQVAAERRMLEQIIQQMPASVFIAEAPSGRLILGNAGIEHQLGRPFVAGIEQREYQDAFQGYHADGRPYAPEEWPLSRAVTRGEVIRNEPIDMVRGDGSRVVIEWSAAPIRDADGHIRYGVVVGVDATERTRLLRHEVRRSQQLKGLAEAATALNAAPTVERLLAEATGHARAIIGAGRAVARVVGSRDRAPGTCAVSPPEAGASWSGGELSALMGPLSRPVRMTRAEVEAHPRLAAERDRQPPPRGWMAAPLTGLDGRSLGVLEVLDREEGEFSEEDEAILVQLAQLTSVALENARLREEALRAERRYRSLVEATTQVVWNTSPDGQVVEDSPSWRAFTGQTLEQYLGTGWLDAIHPEDREHTLAAWRRAVESRCRYEVEYRLRRADGTWASTLVRGVPITGPGGEVREWVGCNADITEVRRAEAQLLAQHQLTRTITNNATLGLLMMDARQHCTFMNPAAEKITGFTLAEVQALDRPLHDIIHHLYPDGRPFPMEECPIDRALPKKAQEQGEGVFVHKDGHFYDVAFTASPILEQGQPVGTVIEVRDITAQKRAERERERLIQALARSNAELDQFAYVASHDLKAPLRGISSLSQWLEEDLAPVLTEQAREQLLMLRVRVHRMEALIDGILDYSRAGRVRHTREVVDVGRLLEDVVELLSPPPEARIEVQPGMPALEAERIPLQQVFLNLLGNALKHARRGDPHVRVGVQDVGAAFQFSVADNGPGIAPRFHQRIWTLFQKLEARDRVEGAGIGLSVVKKIIESRGGQVWVESEEGRGATFHFTWPKREQPSV